MNVKMDRLLIRRGVHRFSGNVFLGTIASFLSGVLVIRISTNLVWAVILALRYSRVDLTQIATAHFLLLSAYILWFGFLSSFRIGSSLPSPSFLNTLPRGRNFLSLFKTKILFFRPIFLATNLLILCIAAVFLTLDKTGQGRILVRSLEALIIVFVGTGWLRVVAAWFPPEKSEAQVLEMVFLMVLVLVNLDLGFVGGKTSALFFTNYFSINKDWVYCSILFLIIEVESFLLIFLRMLSLIKRTSFYKGSPLEYWYLRQFKLHSWLLLYALFLPIWISPFITRQTKIWGAVIFAGVSVSTFLSVLNTWENNLREKWRFSLLCKGNIPLLLRPLAMHLFLTLLPVIAYLVLVRI